MSAVYNLAAAPATQAIALGQIGALLRTRRALVAWIVLSVLAGAALELAPPLLMQRIVDDHLTIGRADGLLRLAGLYLLADVLRLISVVVAMLALSPLLSLVAALVVPPLWWVTRFFQVRVRDAERNNRQAVGRLNTHLQESLSGVEVIRAFGRDAAFGHRFRLALSLALAAYNQAAVYASLYTPLMAILASLVVALLLWVGALNSFTAWNVSLGTLTAFVLLFRRFFTPIINLGDEWQTVQSALSGAERIFQVWAVPAESRRPTPKAVSEAAFPARERLTGETHAEEANIELRDVTFGYLPERPVLRGVSLKVQAGEQVALVGRTGAGKTSALHLLAGMYAAWSGTVRAAGQDPSQLPDSERRRLVGVVPQRVQLFSGTILDNLTLGDAAVTRADVERAAAITGAADFICALPQGYDTPFGSGSGMGAQLSAGQRQLLALTRALVWNPPVLMLDEATALIDSASEAAFRAALRAGQTQAVLIIAHRLSTVREADRVIVMDAGRIVEEGTPEGLIRRGGRFAALLELEAAGWDWQA